MDVQLYLFINGAWQEYNPKPAAHNHTISEVTGLQTQLNSKLNLSGGTMTGSITMGSNNITGNNSSIFQAGRIIATNSNTNDHGITSKGTRANMLYLMDGATGGLAASLLDVDVKNTTTPQKRIAKIGVFGSATSGTGGTPSANYLWLSAVEGNTYNVDATLKVDAQNRVGIAISGSGRPTQALDVGGKIRMRTATVDADGADTVVTKGYMLSKIDLSEMAYFNYASRIYGAKYNLLASAWEHSLTVDPLEIERNSTTSTQYGKLQYPNGELFGVIIPSGTTSIGQYAFRGWTANNQPLVIPNSVTSIGNYAFYGWSANNQPLVIPESVTSIGGDAFRNWTSNNQPLVIPESVTSISERAFQGWNSNKQPLVIPNSVTSIGNNAFRYWLLVPYVEIKAVTPPSLTNYNAFTDQNDAPIYVPDESLDDYKTATNWISLADRIFSINDK